jgi:hypothetical protein
MEKNAQKVVIEIILNLIGLFLGFQNNIYE